VAFAPCADCFEIYDLRSVILHQTSRHYSEPVDNNRDLARKVKGIENEAR
jgi:hypothetical protein